jgi:hypothetical protein
VSLLYIIRLIFEFVLCINCININKKVYFLLSKLFSTCKNLNDTKWLETWNIVSLFGSLWKVCKLLWLKHRVKYFSTNCLKISWWFYLVVDKSPNYFQNPTWWCFSFFSYKIRVLRFFSYTLHGWGIWCDEKQKNLSDIICSCWIHLSLSTRSIITHYLQSISLVFFFHHFQSSWLTVECWWIMLESFTQKK